MKQINILILLLLALCVPLDAQTDTMRPFIRTNKAEINLCDTTTNAKNFILTVDLWHSVSVVDSLEYVEMMLAYDQNNIILDGIYTMGTLAEQFVDYPASYEKIPNGGDYAAFRITGGNITKPVTTTSTTTLIAISGKYINEVPTCSDFFIHSFFCNEEFKIPYNSGRSDSITMCSKINALDINLVSDTTSYEIATLDTTIFVNYTFNIDNPKGLKDWLVTFELPDTSDVLFSNVIVYGNIDSKIIDTSNSYKVVVSLTARDTNAISNIACDVSLSRRAKARAVDTLTATISGINELSCSQNTTPTKVEIVCPPITSIEEEIIFLPIIVDNNNKNIEIRTNASSLEIYDVLGRNVLIDEDIYLGKRIDFNALSRGVYLLRLNAVNPYTQTLIIN